MKTDISSKLVELAMMKKEINKAQRVYKEREFDLLKYLVDTKQYGALSINYSRVTK
jgi:hypothetical protein